MDAGAKHSWRFLAALEMTNLATFTLLSFRPKGEISGPFGIQFNPAKIGTLQRERELIRRPPLDTQPMLERELTYDG